jgi:RNA ligase (TIGR02306 family)
MATVNEVEANEVTDRDLLAVVYKVESLEAIPNKDRIELVHLDSCGYTCICEKGHTVGDLVVFIKYDTILPKIEMFNWMAESKYRVKPKSFTERDEEDNIVKKIYSQGIVMPLQIIKEYLTTLSQDEVPYDTFDNPTEGVDLTKALGITKYIAPVSNGGMGNMASKGDFPTHIVSKTDESNVCSKMKALPEIQGKAVYITQKIEGSSLTFYLDDATSELIVCSRNNMLIESDGNKFWQGVKKHDIFTKLEAIPWLICQAELAGSGIQGNKLKIDGVDIFIFNMIDKRDRRRLGWDEMEAIAIEHDLPLVPLVATMNSFNLSFDELQSLSDSQKYSSGELAEGIVLRPQVPFYSNTLKDLWSVKIINRDYKL